MENMEIYNKVRNCPPEALREIQAGKLKGKSDINPMWRIKMLTELYGPCGIGWKTSNETFWTTPGAGGEVVAWCSIYLLYWDKEREEWSEPVFGIGGSMMVDTQRGNLASNDEAYKMAYTDAISVACKALGFAADVYWQADADRTKYGRNETRDPAPQPPAMKVHACERCKRTIIPIKHGGKTYSVEQIVELSKESYKAELCWSCMKAIKAEQEAQTSASTSTSTQEGSCTCEACGNQIQDGKNMAGELWKAKDIAVYTKLRYDRKLCIGCMEKEKANENAG